MSQSTKTEFADRMLSLGLARVSEAAAIASAKLVGSGDEKAADQAAVNAMREQLNMLDIAGVVVIGEGERDEAPMLFIGEEVGNGTGAGVDIALDPLEGTTLTAKANANAMAVLALAPDGDFLNAPDVYMEKIAIGGGYRDGLIDITATPQENLNALAKEKGVDVSSLTVCILDRPRHEGLIAAVRDAGARIFLIADGDIFGVMATSDPDSGIDMYLGSGGAPEGVLAAAALQSIGGQMQGQLLFRNDDEIGRARKLGIEDLDRIYGLDDLASGDVIFCATGVTDGAMLQGVRRSPGVLETHSIVMRSITGTVREVVTKHNSDRKTVFDD